MRILLAKPNKLEEVELIDYFQSLHFGVDIAYDRMDLSRKLDQEQIDIVVFNASNVKDFCLINYINRYYPRVKVIVCMDNGFCSAIEHVRSGAFHALKKPYHLNDLYDCFNPQTDQGKSRD
ncbi:MAG: hypothetical protein U1C33_07595 [Candidatus Cloacimonadaceae bacterium]|nr:hypothetical protein [Candidatus Cloacimonadaceae bacterium]